MKTNKNKESRRNKRFKAKVNKIESKSNNRSDQQNKVDS